MRSLVSAVFLLLALQSVAQTTSTTNDFSITLERVGCLGNCPAYTVTLFGDGSVHYEGKAYVRVEGIRKKTIRLSEVNQLISELFDEDFLHWNEKTVLCVDYPEVRITASLNGQRKQVLEGCSAPGKVLTLADKIDAISSTKSWVGNVPENMAKNTIAGRCGAPRSPSDNQPMPEQFYALDFPKTARRVSCFTSFEKDSTMFDVVRKCGIPDRHVGSGIYIFAYYMNDCSIVTVGTPDLKRLGIRHVKQKKTTVLLDSW